MFEDKIFYHIYPLGLCGAPERNAAESFQADDETPFFAVGEEWISHM